MPDLSIKNDDPYRRAREAAPVAAGSQPQVAASRSTVATRDTAERWQPKAGTCAPRTDTRAARGAEVLLTAMKRSAESVMVDRAPQDHGTKHGIETAGAHGAVEAAAHLLEKVGMHAAGQVLSVASPLVTFLEAGVQVLEQNQRGEITSQRRAAALGFAKTLGAALNRGTRCFDDARKDPAALAYGNLSTAHHERDFFTWGASAAARFVTTLSPAERQTLMVELGKQPSGEKVSQDVTYDLARRIQSHVLGGEWRQP